MKALEHPSVDQEHPLFDTNNPRPDIHQAVYESWMETVEEMNHYKAYVSTIESGMLEINECKAGSERSRKIHIS